MSLVVKTTTKILDSYKNNSFKKKEKIVIKDKKTNLKKQL